MFLDVTFFKGTKEEVGNPFPNQKVWNIPTDDGGAYQ